MREILIVPYNNSWPKLFEQEKELIFKSIPVEIYRIHHIGSTSVKGLPSKPIIDILLEIKKIETLDKLNNYFERIGYECLGEYGIKGRRYYQKGGDDRTHQIHAFSTNSTHVISHLAFRDYLIANKDIAEEYENVKSKAAEACNNDIGVYCDLKNEFIVKHEKLAVDWWQDTKSLN
ncbi:GrpB family protein [Teredinibacter sp. KSP-S5-2]|uniref:GrpB family protein n=1 Tax=Teredinibacter sp. KSP-S5-2 TaxID=3034506 RepID=UPI0029347C37|nr:GrpB family protein [Teredinibacter sp. KSP-S5-2]WNO09933.1 GrpB family protein [Teredinibacter sp. KSP-S5-2]